MTDPKALATDAIQQLDRLGAVILDDVGDGPTAAVFSARAADAHAAVARIGVSAISEVTQLIVGVGESITAGLTEWNPALGGTLMAAVDDLRALIGRASAFTAEDSEHLHQRAVDLASYVHTPRGASASAADPAVPVPAAEVVKAAAPTAPSHEAKPMAPRVSSISSFFYADGPQVVAGGVPKAAASASEMLGAGIDALDNLVVDQLASPAEKATTVIPVGELTYRGRAALERAAALREQIKSSGSNASPQTLDEMYDLIDLALKD